MRLRGCPSDSRLLRMISALECAQCCTLTGSDPTHAPSTCQGCQAVRYCGPACQQAAAVAHQRECAAQPQRQAPAAEAAARAAVAAATAAHGRQQRPARGQPPEAYLVGTDYAATLAQVEAAEGPGRRYTTRAHRVAKTATGQYLVFFAGAQPAGLVHSADPNVELITPPSRQPGGAPTLSLSVVSVIMEPGIEMMLDHRAAFVACSCGRCGLPLHPEGY